MNGGSQEAACWNSSSGVENSACSCRCYSSLTRDREIKELWCGAGDWDYKVWQAGAGDATLHEAS